MPIGTVVYERTRTTDLAQVADLTANGQRVLIAKGGLGGRGNAQFATSTNRAPQTRQPGLPGEEKDLRLHLKLLADVGLVGFPNAGKSTMISRISAARPKIADYPFTTLMPNLGVVGLSGDRTFVVADVPGLIEGAHAGHGLGHRFLSHLERTKVLVHLVDVSSSSGRDPVEDFDVIMRELELFPGRDASGERLADKPLLVAANKIDALDEPERLARLRATFAAGRAFRSTLSRRRPARGSTALLEAVWREVDGARRDASRSPDRRSTASRTECTRGRASASSGARSIPIHFGHLETARAAREALGARPRAADALARSAAPDRAARRLRVSPLRDGGAGGQRHRRARGERPRARRAAARRTRPTRWSGCTQTGLRRDRRFSSSPAPTRLQKSKRGADTGGPRPGALRRRLASRVMTRRRCATRCPPLRPRMRCRDAPTPAASGDVLRFSCSMRDTPDVSSTEIRRRLGAGESVAGLVSRRRRTRTFDNTISIHAHDSHRPSHGRSLAWRKLNETAQRRRTNSG